MNGTPRAQGVLKAGTPPLVHTSMHTTARTPRGPFLQGAVVATLRTLLSSKSRWPMTSVTIHTSLGSIHTSCCADLGNSVPWRAEKLWDISHEGHDDQEIGILKES